MKGTLNCRNKLDLPGRLLDYCALYANIPLVQKHLLINAKNAKRAKTGISAPYAFPNYGFVTSGMVIPFWWSLSKQFPGTNILNRYT